MNTMIGMAGAGRVGGATVAICLGALGMAMAVAATMLPGCGANVQTGDAPEAWCASPCEEAVCAQGAPVVCSENVELLGPEGVHLSTCVDSGIACGGRLWCCTD